MIFKLTLGDWSNDGHGISREILFDCNYDLKTIQDGYKKSSKDLKIAFDTNAIYTEPKLGYSSDRHIWTDYQDRGISEEAFEVLKNNNCFRNVYTEDELERMVKENIEEGNEEKYFFDLEDKDCAMIIMNFIAISMPDDFKYEVVTQDIPAINGFWGDLNVQFGYGLYD